ncbi:Ig-like domain-containing protein [Xylanibacter ruminicola]|uniref:Ig-like domain-containing protein n=1 Tax=Xylanibacter ruminicola TaxID=839 RepID=A0A1M6URV3_XYLRU|nr:Ig-like domain-containing protein [Xylanibacter ruminicola]SHK71982.1 Ig-like domain-containing protein [Xylanibacter ruminicola]
MKKLLYIFCIALAMVGCARMGQPDGGWYDDDPPKVIGCTPADQATNVTAKKITILFDEYIKLTDATNKVIVSPPQLEVPDIKATGKKIVVELQDSLVANTTYTIDFSDAISDNNENNPMGSYTYSFSTGEQIDTFEVSGYVLDASNLEPIKGIMVGLYNDLADSAFKTKPMLRVSRTDGSGHFVVKGVAPGTYRAYALQDADGDFRFSQKSEMIGFNQQIFEPSSKPDFRTDTIWRDSLHIDGLIRVPYTHFLPDDITLLAFTHVQTDRFLIKTERVEANKFSMYFTYGHPELPVIKGLNFNSDDAFVVEANEKQDTIHYWLRDTALVNQDTLRMEISYQMTDTAGVLVNMTDTIEGLAKVPFEKRQKELNKELEKWRKEVDKKIKRGEEVDTVWREKPLEPKYDVPSSMDPDKIARIEMPTPLQHCDTAGVHLYSMIDSVWYESSCQLVPVPNKIRNYEILAEWRPGIEYSLEIDSAAFIDIYGKVSNAYKQGIKVKSEDEYSTLKLNIAGVEDSAMVVQLLNGSGKMVKQSLVKKHVAEFKYIKPDKYYVSAFIDSNGNGVWDTGDYAEGRQAEAVYYYPREIECKAKWDVSQSWNVTATPIYKQKPGKITKQKPDTVKKLKNRNAERARQLGIEYLKGKGINIDNK